MTPRVDKPPPLCRYCGGPIAKRTVTHWIETDPRYMGTGGRKHLVNKDALPRTKADCQLLTNDAVMSVRRSHTGATITRFSTWDGESYVDKFFCNGDHARQFGYAFARQGDAMPAYHTELSRQWRHGSVA